RDFHVTGVRRVLFRSVVLGRHVYAPLTLQGLEEHRRGARGGRRLDRLDVVVVDEDEAGERGTEGLAVARRAGRRDGRERAAVEAVVRRDDLVGAVAVLDAPLAGELDRGLVGLGTGVLEEDLVECRV